MTKKDLPKISDAEWIVADVLWENSPLTSFEITDTLEQAHSWSPKTIKTLIFRLVKKGVIGFEKKRREYSYFPLISKEEYLVIEGDGFLRRLFNGATAPMVAHFIKNNQISAQEAKELRKILDEISEA